MVIELLVIGAAIAVDPIPMAGYLVVLPSKRGVVKGAAFVFGWFVSLAVVVAVTVLATGNNPPRSHTSPSLAALAIKIAIGVGLVYIGLRRRRQMGRPKAPKRPPRWQADVDSMSPWSAMVLAPLLQPWGLIATGSATVVQAELSSLWSFVALVGFCLLASSTYVGLELYSVLRAEESHALLVRTRKWMGRHTDQVIVIGSLVLGVWLIVDGIYLVVT